MQKGFSKILTLVIVLAAIATGVLVWWQWQKPAEVEQLPANETANWQTYRNEEYGFELKYPNDWQKGVEDFEDLVVFRSPRAQEASVASPQNNYGVISVRVLADRDAQGEIDIEKLGAKTIDEKAVIQEDSSLVAGREARRVELVYKIADDAKNLEISTYLEHQRYIYRIHLVMIDITDAGTEQQTRDIYNIILSTFRFLE